MICNIDELQQYIDKWKEKWKNNLQINPKLRTYITFKDKYCTEIYVKECLPRKERSLLAQIRFGILPLHIDTGRFRILNLKLTCWICNSQEIEDEFLLGTQVTILGESHPYSSQIFGGGGVWPCNPRMRNFDTTKRVGMYPRWGSQQIKHEERNTDIMFAQDIWKTNNINIGVRIKQQGRLIMLVNHELIWSWPNLANLQSIFVNTASIYSGGLANHNWS